MIFYVFIIKSGIKTWNKLIDKDKGVEQNFKRNNHPKVLMLFNEQQVTNDQFKICFSFEKREPLFLPKDLLVFKCENYHF